MKNNDKLLRFFFEGAGVRGEWVHLDASWRKILSTTDYPEAVRNPLGHAMAAVVLLSATVKFNGSLILQAQGDGPLHTLVAQATHRRTVRGLAHWRGDIVGKRLTDMFGRGRLVLTISSEGADPYQGIVPLQGNTLSDALETYFLQSEQLPTRFWLAADERCACGLFLQVLPSERGEKEDWDRIVHLAGTITETEMLTLGAEELLYRLFHEEQVRLFEPEPVIFRCGCSKKTIERALFTLGREELDEIVEAQGMVEVTCDFCNRTYRFDRVDVGELLAGTVKVGTSKSRH